MGEIYKISNSQNNKVYIGKTTRTVEIRWREHLKYAKDESRVNKIYRAMRKYGIENFKIEILEDHIPDDQLSSKEQEYILQYDSYYNGYNETFGGEGESKVDKAELIRLYNQGYNFSEIAGKTNHTPKTVANNLKALGYESKVTSPYKGKGKPVIFQGQEFPSLTILAEYLQNTIPKFQNKKTSTIIKGISKNTKLGKPYCGYTFIYKQQ